jgi:hypothetical protein
VPDRPLPGEAEVCGIEAVKEFEAETDRAPVDARSDARHVLRKRAVASPVHGGPDAHSLHQQQAIHRQADRADEHQWPPHKPVQVTQPGLLKEPIHAAGKHRPADYPQGHSQPFKGPVGCECVAHAQAQKSHHESVQAVQRPEKPMPLDVVATGGPRRGNDRSVFATNWYLLVCVYADKTQQRRAKCLNP